LDPKKDIKNVKVKTVEKDEEVYGAKFFGGSAIKEELFDEELEASADKLLRLYPKKASKSLVQTTEKEGSEEDQYLYHRFQDVNAFPDEQARTIAQRLQASIRMALYDMENEEDGGITALSSIDSSIYSTNNFEWDTPLSKDKSSRTPLDELTNSLSFYRKVDVAIISAQTTSSNTVKMRWEISLIWPTVYDSRVMIPGYSILTIDNNGDENASILSQQDFLENGGNNGKDIIRAISSQLQPRFWDLYHIGMTPSAELMPKLTPKTAGKGLLSSYNLYEIPERLVYQPKIVDTGGRIQREAQVLPNHSFCSIIKTTGPKANRYVTTSPVEVSIRREATSQSNDITKETGQDDAISPSQNGAKKSKSVITWTVPLPSEFVSYADALPLPEGDKDDEEWDEKREPSCSYSYQRQRLVATMEYGGDVQDEQVTQVREKLYEQVIKDGLKPKMDDNGRPLFFFWQNDVKACFTANGGLGMAVYDWRPRSAKSNEVGIELEL